MHVTKITIIECIELHILEPKRLLQYVFVLLVVDWDKLYIFS